MSDLANPKSTCEMYLGAISGDYSGILPEPTCRMEEYLKKINEKEGSTKVDPSLTQSGQAADAEATGEKIRSLEAISHTHSNKNVLDEITQIKVDKWDDAAQAEDSGWIELKLDNKATSDSFLYYRKIGKNIELYGELEFTDKPMSITTLPAAARPSSINASPVRYFLASVDISETIFIGINTIIGLIVPAGIEANKKYYFNLRYFVD